MTRFLGWAGRTGNGKSNRNYNGKSRSLRDDNKGTSTGNYNGNGEIQGSVRLRCSQSAVSNFAQDDV
jgi:hypothetical protein